MSGIPSAILFSLPYSHLPIWNTARRGD